MINGISGLGSGISIDKLMKALKRIDDEAEPAAKVTMDAISKVLHYSKVKFSVVKNKIVCNTWEIPPWGIRQFTVWNTEFAEYGITITIKDDGITIIDKENKNYAGKPKLLLCPARRPKLRDIDKFMAADDHKKVVDYLETIKKGYRGTFIWAVMNTFLTTGLRCSELCRKLKVVDCHLDGEQPYIMIAGKMRKEGEQDLVYLPKDATNS